MRAYEWPKKVVAVVAEAEQKFGRAHREFQTQLRQHAAALTNQLDSIALEVEQFKGYVDLESQQEYADIYKSLAQKLESASQVRVLQTLHSNP